MPSKKATQALPAPSPVGGKVRNNIFRLRCLQQKQTNEEDFLEMKAIINDLEGCALHMEEIEQHIPVSEYKLPMDSKRIANELGRRMEN
ncbi:hypothetical protein [Maridesulfovibrio sp.]|uniref:hypothetical protein n=1 Tax=Maridesulfovibrio sp. TaxID=2795000 RepID=UPI002A18C3CE|nr:hypothetical protein [Maridesulfovibrio sp.]